MSLAEFSDTSCFLPCKRCAEFLQEGDRFCRFCGEDQLEADGAGGAESAAGPARGTSTRARSPFEMDFADTLQPDEEAAVGHLVPASAANEEANREIGPGWPNAFGQKGLLRGSSAKANPWAISILSLGILLALALGHDLYLDKRRANVEQMQGALIRGDLSAAGLELGALDQEKQQGPAAKREPLRNTALEVSKALGLGESAAAYLAEAPLPPKEPMVAALASEIGVADPKEFECSAALAALALCKP